MFQTFLTRRALKGYLSTRRAFKGHSNGTRKGLKAVEHLRHSGTQRALGHSDTQRKHLRHVFSRL